MIPKTYRLSRTDFARRPARRAAFPYGSLTFLPGAPGAAVVVSKKVLRSAADRNKLRRRFYALMRPFVLKGALRGAVIVYPNRLAAAAPFPALKAALERALAT